jgi:hypothetical protein
VAAPSRAGQPDIREAVVVRAPAAADGREAAVAVREAGDDD